MYLQYIMAYAVDTRRSLESLSTGTALRVSRCLDLGTCIADICYFSTFPQINSSINHLVLYEDYIRYILDHYQYITIR